MANIKNLIAGYNKFYQEYFVQDNCLYKSLAENGQSPRTLVIACSDSRVDPSLITSTKPGDIFVIRNVANLIPPYQKDKITYHGTSAALEFAILNLNIENILLLGHSECAGVRAMVKLNEKQYLDNNFSFVKEWVKIASNQDNDTIRNTKFPNHNNSYDLCGQKALLISLENLRNFPWIKERLQAGKLNIEVWYFYLHSGKIISFDQKDKRFYEIDTHKIQG